MIVCFNINVLQCLLHCVTLSPLACRIRFLPMEVLRKVVNPRVIPLQNVFSMHMRTTTALIPL